MENKPGIKTTEFWITAGLAILGMIGPTLVGVYGGMENAPEWATPLMQIIGAVVAAAAAFGYNESRTRVKRAEIVATADIEIAKAEASAVTPENSLQVISTRLVGERTETTKDGKVHLGLLGVILVALISLPAIVGCDLTPKAYDEVTIGQVRHTMVYERDDYEMSRQALEACGASEIAKLELMIRHASEILRLEMWEASEEAKKLPEEN